MCCAKGDDLATDRVRDSVERERVEVEALERPARARVVNILITGAVGSFYFLISVSLLPILSLLFRKVQRR